MSKVSQLYAPCDREIIKLEDLKDGVFSEKMLGEGFVIIPSSNEFFSPVKSGYVESIFETKHAFHIKDETGAIILMHIGLDSVKLQGKGFKLLTNVGSKINLKDKLVEVDYNYFDEQSGISKATPIVMSETESNGHSFNLIKTGMVKQGEVIGELVLNVKQEIVELEALLNKQGKWESIAKQIYEQVGTKANYLKFYNCVTRFRVVIKDKSLINIEAIKKIESVKGTKWNGDELQIIIGGEVYKLREAFEKYTQGLDEKLGSKNKMPVKRSFKDKLLAAVTGIIIPALPVIIAAGILKAIQAILTQSGVIAEVSFDALHPNIASYDLFTGLVYIIAEAGLSFMGIYFCYNTVRYLGGNGVMGIFVGLALVCPFLYSGGDWLSFKLFTIGNTDIAIKGYQSSIIPQICAGLLYFYIDKWVQKWIPTSIDIVLRPATSFLLAITASFVIIGPVMGIIESGINTALTYLNNVPFGIGVGIFTLLWQPIVLTGMHYPLILPIMLDQAQNDTTSVILVGTTIGVLGQAGATLAVVLRTKSAQTKSIGIGSLPAAFFGVTEPAIYGVNLPKLWPFIYGCVGAGIAGFVSGLLNVVSYAGATPSMGLIFVVGFVRGGIKNISLGIFVLLLAAVISFLLVLLTYQDRPNEAKSIKLTSKTLAKIYFLKTGEKLANSSFNQRVLEIDKYMDKEKLELIKKVANNLSIIERFDVNIARLTTNEESEKELVLMKIKKAIAKENIEKVHLLKEKYDKIDYAEKINVLAEKRETYIKEKEDLLIALDPIQEALLEKTNALLENVSKAIDYNKLYVLQSGYFNAIHSVDIAFGITEKQDNLLPRSEIKKIKTLNVQMA